MRLRSKPSASLRHQEVAVAADVAGLGLGEGHHRPDRRALGNIDGELVRRRPDVGGAPAPRPSARAGASSTSSHLRCPRWKRWMSTCFRQKDLARRPAPRNASAGRARGGCPRASAPAPRSRRRRRTAARKAPLAMTPVSSRPAAALCGGHLEVVAELQRIEAALLELQRHLLVRLPARHRTGDGSGLRRPKIVGRTVMVIAAGATTSRAICSSAFSNIAAVGSLAKVTLASTL